MYAESAWLVDQKHALGKKSFLNRCGDQLVGKFYSRWVVPMFFWLWQLIDRAKRWQLINDNSSTMIYSCQWFVLAVIVGELSLHIGIYSCRWVVIFDELSLVSCCRLALSMSCLSRRNIKSANVPSANYHRTFKSLKFDPRQWPDGQNSAFLDCHWL